VATPFQGVGAEIRHARKARGLSQAELSKQLGISQATLSRAELSTDVRLATVLQLARALDQELMLIPRRLVPAVDAIVRHGSVEGSFPSLAQDAPYDESYDELDGDG
jgi:HTH-type transcriptional regulator / antitoxin HipB